MNGWVIFAIGLGAALMLMVPVVAASMWWQVPADREAAKARVVAEQRIDNMLWAAGFPHDAPDHELGVREAHQTMQRHRGCRADECRRKAAAQQTLIAAGRMKPDTSREY
ncbi:hypothetical protein IU470_06915 [Nocardia abscessus]|uniref:Uncharacterized protein n=1 Tax=Nocardia abscessus TaxID=120957 RepID=A0ABS0C377_9NOCA|nr:hypothetical protein [Nocardia abscessus]MBF6224839.1 hypothetical protein [Nocardia abscessus]